MGETGRRWAAVVAAAGIVLLASAAFGIDGPAGAHGRGLAAVALPPVDAGAADPTEETLERVFGPVSVTTTSGGPAHNGREPAEWANVSGVRDGTYGVMYRSDQSTCPAQPDYLPPCTTPSTWRWDPTTRMWTELSGATEPGGRLAASSSAVAAGANGQAWIYSGQDHQDGGPYDSATYVLGDDGHWAPAPCTPSCAVGPIDGAVGAASPTDSLLFGGDYVGDPPTPPFYDGLYSNTVFRWTGSDWEQLTIAGDPPPARAAAGFAYDGRDFIVFGGGYAGAPTAAFPSGFGDFRDTWRLRKDAAVGTWSWEQVCAACGPVGRHQGTMTGLWKPGHPSHGALLVGGQAFNGTGLWDPAAPPEDEFALSDVWAWDGHRWIEVRPIGTPCDVSPANGVPCWADPAVGFAPFSASMPSAGAAMWTEGACTAYGASSVGPFITQTCERRTVQVTLDDAAVAVPTVPVAPTVAVPQFTG